MTSHTYVLLGIVAVSSHSVQAQLSNLRGNVNFEKSLEENEFDPDQDFQYDDNAWFEMVYAEEYADEDYAKFEDVRGIPVPTSHKLVSCIEKLDGPFYTIESTSSEEHIYPARYFNISCVRSNDMSQYRGHHKKLPVKCEAGKRECVTTIKEVPVFRKQLKSYNKNCWKPEKLIPVETGCKCVHFK